MKRVTRFEVNRLGSYRIMVNGVTSDFVPSTSPFVILTINDEVFIGFSENWNYKASGTVFKLCKEDQENPVYDIEGIELD